MLAAFGGFDLLAALFEVGVIAVAFLWLALRPPGEPSRRGVLALATLWVLAVTAEYWVLGPRSFVYPGDDGEVVPLFLYLARIHDGGLFAHGLVGGVDAQAMVGAATAWVSLERLVYAWLPIWAAVAVFKLGGAALALAGAYILARRCGGAGRGQALALAVAYTVAHRYVALVSLSHGLGFAIIPLAVYVLVGRLATPHYLAGAVVLGAINAISFTPTISGQALGVAVLVAWVGLGREHPGRFAAGLALLLLPAVVNWSEALFAMAVNAPLSWRSGRDLSAALSDLPDHMTRYFRARAPEALPMALGYLALLWHGDRVRFRRATGMLGAALLGGPLLLTVPWKVLGLGILSSLDFQYALYAFPVILVLVGAWTVPPAAGRGRLLAPAILGLALALGQAAWIKANAIVQLAGTGGLAVYSEYPELRDPAWRPEHPFRTATIPYRIPPNAVAAYGLETVDGVLNLFPQAWGQFWKDAIPNANPGLNSGVVQIVGADSMDYLCCRSYDANRVLAIDTLRMLNVEFVISALPLEGGGLTQVAGPEAGEAVPPRRDQSVGAKVRGAVAALRAPHVRVYRLPDALPRAFLARAVEARPSDPQVLVGQALAGTAQVAPEMVATLRAGVTATGEITGSREVRDGYDIDLSLPQGGVVVVNAVHTPFWQATADGRPVTLVAANAVHMAVAVPPGTQRLELRYRRPLLRELVAARING